MKRTIYSEIEEKIKGLPHLPVYLAEYEYLHDVPAKSGHIDPNALSAGGLPVGILSKIRNEILDNKLLQKKLNEPNSLSDEEILREIKKHDENTLLYNDIVKTFKDLFINLITDEELKLISRYLSNNKITNKNELNLNSLFKNDSELYKHHQINIIKTLIKATENGDSIKNYSNKFLNRLLESLNAIKSNISISKKDEAIHDFYVGWEATLGHCLATLFLMDDNKNDYNVWYDLHSDTNLFTTVPLNILLSDLSKSKYAKIYKLLIHGAYIQNGDELIVKLENSKEEFPYMKHCKSTLEIFYNKNDKIVLESVYSGTHLSTKQFNQYAYLYEHFNKDIFDLKNESHKQMYLSSLLNAKGAFYQMLKSDVEKVVPITYPETCINFDRNWFNKFEDSIKIIIKEGGWCSTGGKGVILKTKKEIIDNPKIYENYIVPVFQEYLESKLFKIEDTEIHGHIRQLSYINADKKIVHLGYFLKLSFSRNINSSAYKSIILTFDDSGEFLKGIMTGNTERYFDSLEEMGIEHCLNKEEWLNVLSNAKMSWLVTTYYINKYLNGDLKKSLNKLVEEGVVSDKYLI